MDQQTIEKLFQIKKLYEAGILTKEEMESEKAKVLGRTNVALSTQATEQQTTNAISQNATGTEGQTTKETVSAPSNEQDMHIGQKRCPKCGEWIGEDDEVCEWCNEWIGDYNNQTPTSSGNAPVEEEQQTPSVPNTQEDNTSQQLTSEDSPSSTYDYSDLLEDEEGIDPKYVKCFGIGVTIVLIILCIYFTVTSTHHRSSYSSDDETVYAQDSSISDDSEPVYYDTEQDEETLDESIEDNDEFAYDAFSGEFKINGGAYRLCDSYAYLSINKGSDGVYSGIMELMMGSQEYDESFRYTGRFDDDRGRAHAQIRGKASGNSLVVIMDSYKIANPGDGTIKEHMPAKGTQIFKITYNNDKYSVQPIGDMQGIFDGYVCATTITR